MVLCKYNCMHSYSLYTLQKAKALSYKKCIYQPQCFIECFNNTSVHQLIHSQKWQVPKKFTSTFFKVNQNTYCFVQPNSLLCGKQKASDKHSLSNAQWFLILSFCTKLVPSSMHPPLKTSVQKNNPKHYI